MELQKSRCVQVTCVFSFILVFIIYWVAAKWTLKNHKITNYKMLQKIYINTYILTKIWSGYIFSDCTAKNKYINKVNISLFHSILHQSGYIILTVLYIFETLYLYQKLVTMPNIYSNTHHGDVIGVNSWFWLNKSF